MYIPKRYGQSKIDRCPFCQKQSTIINKQDVPVCHEHKNELLDDLKCACGSVLDIQKGKFGVFFSCMKCGNMSMRKMLEINTIKPRMKTYSKSNFENNSKSADKQTMTVRNDDPRYFD